MKAAPDIEVDCMPSTTSSSGRLRWYTLRCYAWLHGEAETSSKWQVMHGIIKGLLPILQPVSAPHPQALMGAAATPSYLERFLDVNAQLNRGTLNPDKPARVAHPHCHKVGSPRPCIHVYACMYACVSMHISWLRFTPTLCRLISFEASSRTALWKRP